VAATRTRDLHTHGHTITDALTGGFHTALWVCGLTALAAVPIAFLLIRRTDITQTTTAQATTAPQSQVPEPTPAD
jgi:hypothetical protein